MKTKKNSLQSLQTMFPEQADHQAWHPFIEQQQQDPPEQETDDVDPNLPESPFKNVDKDLLDDEARGKIEAAEAKYFAAFKKDAEIEKLKADHAVEIDKIKKSANSAHLQTQQTQQKTEEQTFEDEIRTQLKAAGIVDPGVLEANVKLQKGMFEKFGQRFGKTIENVLQPLQQTQFANEATSAFNELRADDENFAHDEVAQSVWDKVSELVEKGVNVTKETIENLGHIHYGKFIRANPDAKPEAKITIQPRQQQRMNTQTRHTFPGAGHSATVPIKQANNALEGMDAETAAAMELTQQEWANGGVKVKGLKLQSPLRVTRGN